jgi:DNA-binding MarR family transcriptional regulator
MRFEDAIKTNKFTSENAKSQLNLIYTASVLECFFTSYFKVFDLTMQQYNVMRIVRGQSPKSVKVKDITARILYRNCNTTRIIDKLEVKGLLRREETAQDKRAIHVVITESGLQLLKKIDQEMASNALHRKALDETEAEILSKILDKLRHDFDSSEDECKPAKPTKSVGKKS